MSGSLTRARVAQLAQEIRQCAATARVIDPAESFSYPAMCGGLQATVRALVRDLAGDEAAKETDHAFDDAHRSDS